jgi:hypothetical protein
LFSLSYCIAFDTYKCFIFLISVKFAFLVFWTVPIFKFSEKSLLHQLFHELETVTDPDRPNPDWNALDADPDQDPTKCCGSDPIRILSHNTAANTAKLLLAYEMIRFLYIAYSPIYFIKCSCCVKLKGQREMGG